MLPPNRESGPRMRLEIPRRHFDAGPTYVPSALMGREPRNLLPIADALKSADQEPLSSARGRIDVRPCFTFNSIGLRKKGGGHCPRRRKGTPAHQFRGRGGALDCYCVTWRRERRRREGKTVVPASAKTPAAWAPGCPQLLQERRPLFICSSFMLIYRGRSFQKILSCNDLRNCCERSFECVGILVYLLTFTLLVPWLQSTFI